MAVKDTHPTPLPLTSDSKGPTAASFISGPATVHSPTAGFVSSQDPTWNIDIGASSHLNSNASNLSTIFNTRLHPSVHVGDGNFIPVTNTGHSILPTLHRPLHLHNVLITPNIIKNLISVCQFTKDNNCTIEFDDFGFSVKDFLTRHIHLRCDSSGDLYLVTKPSFIPIALLSTSSSTWHQRLGHPGEEVLRFLVSRQFISCNKEKSSHLCHACQLGKHVKLPFLSSDSVVEHWYAIRVGFYHSRCNPSLFIYRHGPEVAYLLIYVDDIILTASFTALLQCIIASLYREFDMTDLGALNYFLGIFVLHNSKGLFLSQRKYALQLLERAHMVTCNPSRTPVDTESKLGPDGVPVSDPTLYRSLAGGLQYLTFTLYASSTASLVAYSDADWAGCPSTRRSTSGYCVFLGDNLLSCSSKRQHTLSRSNAKAEYRGVANVVAETAWLCNLLRELHFSLLSATLVYFDNVSAIYLSVNPVQHQRTKHIEIDILFVCHMVTTGQVRVLHVPSRYQYADILLRASPRPKPPPLTALRSQHRHLCDPPAAFNNHRPKDLPSEVPPLPK
ncbi:ribonuclease H-like domain-containing protein [Tanacetum coccineum]